MILNNLIKGSKQVDITAHARWINSIDIKENRLVSSGEDCFFRVWELNEINGKLKVIIIETKLKSCRIKEFIKFYFYILL